MTENKDELDEMTNEMAVYALDWILDTIIERKQEAKKEAEETKSLFDKGRNFAYYEVVDIIKNRL